MYGSPSNSADDAAAEDEKDTKAVLDGIRRIVQALRVASRDSEKNLGLTAAQLFVLEKLSDCKAICVNELASRTLTHQSTVSVVVQRLVDRGLVLTRRSKDDARRMELTLTPGGKKVIAKSPGAAQQRLIAALQSMPPKQRRQLAVLMDKLVVEMGVCEGAPPLLFEEESNTKRQIRRGNP